MTHLSHSLNATPTRWTGRLVAFVLAALLGVVLGASATAQTVRSEQARYDGAVEQLAAREAAFDVERAAYERELAAVERFRQLEAVTPFDTIELREALQRANTAAEAMRARDEEARQAASDVERARRALVDALRAEIAERESRFGQLTAGQVMAEISALNELQQRVSELSRPVRDDAGRVPLDDILHGLPETAEEMWAAADELDDHAARLERELEALRDQLDDALVQARLADRVSEFGMEESLFDDGAGRRAPLRASQSGTSAAASPTGEGDERAEAEADDSPLTGGGGDVAGGGASDMPNSAPLPGGGDDSSADEGADFGAPEPDSEAGAEDPGTDGPTSGLDGPALPSLGATINDPVMPGVGAERVGTGAVELEGGTADPTIIGTGVVSERERRRGQGRVGELRALEQQLQRQLEQVQGERDRLRRTADLLEP